MFTYRIDSRASIFPKEEQTTISKKTFFLVSQTSKGSVIDVLFNGLTYNLVSKEVFTDQPSRLVLRLFETDFTTME